MDAGKREALIRRALDPASSEAEVAKALEVLRKAGVKFEDFRKTEPAVPEQSATEKPHQDHPARKPTQQYQKRERKAGRRNNQQYRHRFKNSENAFPENPKNNPIKLHESSFRDDAVLFVVMFIVLCIVCGSIIYLVAYDVL